MSINTQVFLDLNDGDPADIPDLEERVMAFLEANRLSPHVFEDVRQLLAAGQLEPFLFALSADALIALFTMIAEADPELGFWVRGVGELGAGDTWVREFAEGKVVFAAGPFPAHMTG